ncbi:uncharacterized protein [Acropora muricata]|uniref:uncharacterized protein n=1 Tax=Acropora muricata TaxID=159855 RepID=UPI0034E61AC7
MASCSGQSIEAVERRKGFWWSKEDTLLISHYREHEKLFMDVNCKKKSIWELITASTATENPNFSARPEQVEGKWKSLTLAFRKCCDHNSISGHDRKECLLYKEIAEFYGYRPNVRPYATSSSSGKADYVRPKAESQQEKPEQTEEEERNEEEVTVVLIRPATSQGRQGSLQEKKRLSKKENGVKSRNEYLQWLQEYKEEKKNEEEKKLEKFEAFHNKKIQVLGGMFEVLRGLKEQ